MPIQGDLAPARGKTPGSLSYYSETHAVNNDSDVDTGFGTVVHVVAQAQTGDPAAGSIDVAQADVVNGGTVNVTLATVTHHTGGNPEATLVAQTNTHNVTIMAIGSRRPPQ